MNVLKYINYGVVDAGAGVPHFKNVFNSVQLFSYSRCEMPGVGQTSWLSLREVRRKKNRVSVALLREGEIRRETVIHHTLSGTKRYKSSRDMGVLVFK